jgi:hypothetical protein
MKKPDEEKLLEKFAAAINESGFDSFFEIPDYFLAKAVIAMLPPLVAACHVLLDLMMDEELINNLKQNKDKKKN